MEVISVWLVFTCIGALIGHRKGRLFEGAAAGILLGPIGCLWIYCADARAACRECGGFVIKDARKCLHCGSVIAKFSGTVYDSRFDPLYLQKTTSFEDVDLDDEVAEVLRNAPLSKSPTRPHK